MKKVLAAAILSALAAPTFAEGFYAGFDVGSASADTSSIVTVKAPSASASKNKTVAGIYAGYDFTPNWAVEAKYTGAGENKATTAAGGVFNVKADAFALTLVGTAPLSDSFEVYGKLGYASTKTTVTSSIAGAYSGASRNAATYGVGAQYNVSKAVGIRLGYDVYPAQVQDNTAGSPTLGNNNFNTSVWAIGAKFNF